MSQSSDDQHGGQGGEPKTANARDDRSVWTPFQFTVGQLLVAFVPVAVLCAMLKIGGPAAPLLTIVGALLCWIGVNMFRLITRSSRSRGDGDEADTRPQSHGPLEQSEDELLARLAPLAETTRYPVDAYLLVIEALRLATEQAHAPASDPALSHVDAAAVCRHVRDLAIAEYGAKTTARAGLASMNIYSCEDIGRITFNLIDAGLAGASKDDRIEDFSGVFDFDEAFGTADAG